MLKRLDGMLVRLDNMRARGEKVIGELDEVIEALSKLPDRPQRCAIFECWRTISSAHSCVLGTDDLVSALDTCCCAWFFLISRA